MKTSALIIASMLTLAGANALAMDSDPNGLIEKVNRLLQGRFDNREQVAQAPADAAPPPVHVSVTIEGTPLKDFTLWHVHLTTDPQSTFDQTWAMQTRIEADGSGALIPYYQLHQDDQPSAASFDSRGWLSLEACALRGSFAAKHVEAISEGEPCVAVSMSVGARRALLPVALSRSGDSLRLHMNLRGERTLIDAKRAK